MTVLSPRIDLAEKYVDQPILPFIDARHGGGSKDVRTEASTDAQMPTRA